MKKALLFVLLATTISIATMAQSKTVKPTVLLSDTITVKLDSTTKFVKIGNQLLQVDQLKKPGFWFTKEVLDAIQKYMEQLPGYICNPANKKLEEFFSPPKQ